MSETTTEEIVLSVRQWHAQRRIDHPIIREMGMVYKNFETYLWPMLEDYDASGLRHICKAAIREEPLVEYPKDWWQAVKERWLPRFILKHRPVVYTKVIAMHKFPHWQKELGKECVEVRYVKNGNSD